jgi:hypothetical protein
MYQSVTSKRAAAQRHPDDPDRHYLIYCDESGLHGTRLTGFGSLWMTYERRGDFQQIWRDLHDRYFPPSEVKWERVKKETQPFFEALVDEFFRRKVADVSLLTDQQAGGESVASQERLGSCQAQAFHVVSRQQDSPICDATKALHDSR